MNLTKLIFSSSDPFKVVSVHQAGDYPKSGHRFLRKVATFFSAKVASIYQ